MCWTRYQKWEKKSLKWERMHIWASKTLATYMLAFLAQYRFVMLAIYSGNNSCRPLLEMDPLPYSLAKRIKAFDHFFTIVVGHHRDISETTRGCLPEFIKKSLSMANDQARLTKHALTLSHVIINNGLHRKFWIIPCYESWNLIKCTRGLRRLRPARCPDNSLLICMYAQTVALMLQQVIRLHKSRKEKTISHHLLTVNFTGSVLTRAVVRRGWAHMQ